MIADLILVPSAEGLLIGMCCCPVILRPGIDCDRLTGTLCSPLLCCCNGSMGLISGSVSE